MKSINHVSENSKQKRWSEKRLRDGHNAPGDTVSQCVLQKNKAGARNGEREARALQSGLRGSE